MHNDPRAWAVTALVLALIFLWKKRRTRQVAALGLLSTLLWTFWLLWLSCPPEKRSSPLTVLIAWVQTFRKRWRATEGKGRRLDV